MGRERQIQGVSSRSTLGDSCGYTGHLSGCALHSLLAWLSHYCSAWLSPTLLLSHSLALALCYALASISLALRTRPAALLLPAYAPRRSGLSRYPSPLTLASPPPLRSALCAVRTPATSSRGETGYPQERRQTQPQFFTGQVLYVHSDECTGN